MAKMILSRILEEEEERGNMIFSDTNGRETKSNFTRLHWLALTAKSLNEIDQKLLTEDGLNQGKVSLYNTRNHYNIFIPYLPLIIEYSIQFYSILFYSIYLIGSALHF